MTTSKPLVTLNDSQSRHDVSTDIHCVQTLELSTGPDGDVFIRTLNEEKDEHIAFTKPSEPDAEGALTYNALFELIGAMRKDNENSSHMTGDCNQDEVQLRIHDDCEGDTSQILSVGINHAGTILIHTSSRGGFEFFRFRMPFFGGGMSPNTYHALVGLMNAMREDNKKAD